MGPGPIRANRFKIAAKGKPMKRTDLYVALVVIVAAILACGWGW